MWTIVRFAVVILVVLVASPDSVRANYDVFDDETMNDIGPLGQEIAYTGGAEKVFTISFNTASFGLDPGENGSSPNFNGCSETPAVFAGRTGWVRFNPGVDGRIHVLANTPGFDSIVWIRESREATWKTTIFTDLLGHDNNCSDFNNGPGADETIFPYPGGTPIAGGEFVYFVQIGGKCAAGPTTCTNESMPAPLGGETTIRLTFTPLDGDSDGVADSLDSCDGSGRPGFVTPDGCPDEDRDSIKDSTEGPGCVGQQGVVAAAPYNGCFDGPNPPREPAEASVIIEAADTDTDSTAGVGVFLRLNWPKGAREAFANNSAGDASVRIPLQARVPWTLRPTTKSAVREVEVRFRGPGIDAKDEDTITLDPAPPTISANVVLRGGNGRWYVGVRASDDVGGSGVQVVDVLDSKRKPIKSLRVCSAPPCKRSIRDDVGDLRRKPQFLRVSDAAGNLSNYSTLKASSKKCKIKVPITDVVMQCFSVGQHCSSSNPPEWRKAAPTLTCFRGRVCTTRRRSSRPKRCTASVRTRRPR